MASLTSLLPSNTYQQLLQIGASGVGLTSGLQTVQDGLGNNSLLSLSTTAVAINGFTLTINAALTVTSAITLVGAGHTLTLAGTASVTGTNTGDQTNISGSSGSCTGNAATATTALSISNANLPQKNYVISSSSGNHSSNSSTYVTVTNLSVSLTTTGRPVSLILIPDASVNNEYITITGGGTSTLSFFNGVTSIGNNSLLSAGSFIISSFSSIDTSVVGTPGTYTYTAQIKNASGVNTFQVAYVKLIAYEL